MAAQKEECKDVGKTVNRMTAKEKRKLFESLPQLLNGRYIENNKTMISRPARLFELKNNDEINWAHFVSPMADKDVGTKESFSAFQQDVTESSYWSAKVQAGVAGFGGVTVKSSGMDSTQKITTKTDLYFTHFSVIKKANIAINETIVKYRKPFMSELKKLLKNEEKSENKWDEFTKKFGRYYIEKCDVGGVAYCCRHEQVSDEKERETKKNEFGLSVNATIKGFTADTSNTHGNEHYEEIDKTNKSINVRLKCHGGIESDCTTGSFRKWETSVKKDPDLWDIVEVLEVRPFYYLLPQNMQQKIENLMPKKISKKVPLMKAPERFLIGLVTETFDGYANCQEHVKEIDGDINDINKGFDVKYTYLKPEWGTVKDASKAISDINWDTERVNKSRKVSLTFERDGKDAITELILWRTKHKDRLPVSRGWRYYTTDLNSNQGGRYLYLCFKKKSIEYEEL